jgi:diacylglycerol kinase
MKKFFKGFTYAAKGIVYAFSTQINFKFHTLSAFLVIAMGVFFKLNLNEWLWVSAAIGLVITAEIFNTALEVLVDLVSPGHHPKAGIVKDLSSAGVLITAILAAIIGLCIFLPKLILYAS